MAKRRIRKKTKKELADPELASRSQRQHKIRTAAHATTNKLSSKRRKFILNMTGEWTFHLSDDADDSEFERESRKWERARREFLKTATNPLELHLFASNWNSDAGEEPVYRIVKHQHCDAGTALWLYWENDPYYYQVFEYVKDADSWEYQWLRISRLIERRFRRGDFATAKIPFDPEPWITDRYADAEWVVHEIPEIMHRPVKPRKRRKRKQT